MGEVTRTWKMKTLGTDQLKVVTPRPVPSHTRIGFGLAFNTPGAGVGVGTGVGVGVVVGVGVGVGVVAVVGVGVGVGPQPLVVRKTVVEPRTEPFVASIS